MSKYIPKKVALSVYDIDYNELYASGKKIILFDLDNTLISYDEDLPSKKLIDLGTKLLQIGFKVYIISNNKGKRITNFVRSFPVTGYKEKMKKPFAYKIKKFLKESNYQNLEEIVMIGDQILTDIVCANKVGIDSILVKSISRKSEMIYTTINRLRGPLVLRKYARKNPQYANKIYEIIKKEKNNG